MANKSARVQICDYRNIEAFQILIRRLLRTPVGADWRKFANYKPLNEGSNGFVVFRIGAVIADLRVGEYYDLPGVGWIGEEFLVSGKTGIKNYFSVALCFRAAALASQAAAIFKRKHILHLFHPVRT